MGRSFLADCKEFKNNEWSLLVDLFELHRYHLFIVLLILQALCAFKIVESGAPSASLDALALQINPNICPCYTTTLF